MMQLFYELVAFLNKKNTYWRVGGFNWKKAGMHAGFFFLKQIVNIFYRKVFPILTFVKVLFKYISSKGQVAEVSILLIVAPWCGFLQSFKCLRWSEIEKGSFSSLLQFQQQPHSQSTSVAWKKCRIGEAMWWNWLRTACRLTNDGCFV